MVCLSCPVINLLLSRVSVVNVGTPFYKVGVKNITGFIKERDKPVNI